ncbi:histidine-rich glycoprotein [Erethizon dorsatum]
MGDHSMGWLSTMRVLTVALFVITLQHSWALSLTDCNAAEPEAEKALDVINRGRWNGYLFRLLRVADAHLDRVGPATVYYLVLDVQESDCWVLSGKRLDDCEAASRRPSETVIGQCKVIATRYSNESQSLMVNDFNCTTSSVSSALSNTKDSPVLYDFFEDTEPYRKQADKALDKYKGENDAFASFRVDQVERVIRARGGEGTGYYVDFSVRNCSAYHFPRGPNVFGFCRADLYYDIEASDLETPKNLVVNCEVFNFEEHRNISGMPPHWGRPHHFGKWKHFLPGKYPFNPNRSRDHHHPHKPHEVGCPFSPEEKNKSDGPPLPPPRPRCLLPPFGAHRPHGPPHNHNSSEHDPHGYPPHGHGPHGPHPHGLYPHGPHPHGPHPHGPPPHGPHPHGPPPHGHPPHGPPPHGPPPHGHPPHGPPPHGHPPHGPPPHGHPPHGHPPHGHPPHGPHPHGHPPHGPHPHGHHFHDYGPCDPPHDHQGPKDRHPHGHGHGPSHRHSGERHPGKGHFPFHRRESRCIYRLPPLNVGEVLPLPEANFPSFPLLNCNNSLQPEIQPFPQSTLPSESCPGKFKVEFPQLANFFAYTSSK